MLKILFAIGAMGLILTVLGVLTYDRWIRPILDDYPRSRHSKRVQRVRQRAMEMADRPGSDDQFEDWLGAGDLWRMADEREEAERRLARGRR